MDALHLGAVTYCEALTLKLVQGPKSLQRLRTAQKCLREFGESGAPSKMVLPTIWEKLQGMAT